MARESSLERDLQPWQLAAKRVHASTLAALQAGHVANAGDIWDGGRHPQAPMYEFAIAHPWLLIRFDEHRL